MNPAAKSIGPKISSYLAKQPPLTRRELKRIRTAIRSAAPGAVETFSYGIPGFRFDNRPLVWYAGFKSHLSIFPMTAKIRAKFRSAIKNYGTSTGTIRFPLSKPAPVTLVKRLVRARMAEIRDR